MLKLRLANPSDIKKTFKLSNDEVVRKNSINQCPIKWDEHIKWFNETINSFDNLFYIIETKDNEFAGQIRIKKGVENIISISLSENFRGKGAAWKIIKECSQKSNLKIITAYIKKNNHSSLNAFTKAGYEISENVLINGIEFYKLKCKIV